MTPLFWIFFGVVAVYVVGVFYAVDHFAKQVHRDPHPEWTTTEPERARMNKVVAMGSYRRLR